MPPRADFYGYHTNAKAPPWLLLVNNLLTEEIINIFVNQNKRTKNIIFSYTQNFEGAEAIHYREKLIHLK